MGARSQQLGGAQALRRTPRAVLRRTQGCRAAHFGLRSDRAPRSRDASLPDACRFWCRSHRRVRRRCRSKRSDRRRTRLDVCSHRRQSPDKTARTGAARVTYVNRLIAVDLNPPNGHLVAGRLPTGGERAEINPNGSISAKYGWWRAGDQLKNHRSPTRCDGPAPDRCDPEGLQPWDMGTGRSDVPDNRLLAGDGNRWTREALLHGTRHKKSARPVFPLSWASVASMSVKSRLAVRVRVAGRGCGRGSV